MSDIRRAPMTGASVKQFAVSYCPTCGDFLFNGRHGGNVERWCRELCETKTFETKTPNAETKTSLPQSETKTPETKTRNRGGRPRRKTIAPWEAASISRATWYRQQKMK
jgi:uncharacterized Zn finger protein (UPF0148 family)